MKINFIISSLGGGGAERVMTLLANYFILKGHDVSIITFNDGDVYPLSQRVKRIRLHRGKIRNHTLRSLYNLIFYYISPRNRPDIAISFIRTNNFVSIIACKLFGIKVIASEHNNHLMRYNLVGNFAWDYLYRFADYITVLTSFDKPFFEKKGAKVFVMPNPSTFVPLKGDIYPREKTILAVGKLDRYRTKGFDNLIKLISPILVKHPDWSLIISGGGDDGYQYLNSLVKEEGLEKQISFTGFRNDIISLMQKSEIFILSSRFEGLPMVLLEAMSQGMACIAYDCVTGPSEIINHGENGLLIKDQDMDAMQAGLSNLIENDSLRKQLANNGKNSLDRYSIENVYKLWENLITEITRKT